MSISYVDSRKSNILKRSKAVNCLWEKSPGARMVLPPCLVSFALAVLGSLYMQWMYLGNLNAWGECWGSLLREHGGQGNLLPLDWISRGKWKSCWFVVGKGFKGLVWNVEGRHHISISNFTLSLLETRFLVYISGRLRKLSKVKATEQQAAYDKTEENESNNGKQWSGSSEDDLRTREQDLNLRCKGFSKNHGALNDLRKNFDSVPRNDSDWYRPKLEGRCLFVSWGMCRLQC